ncbi:MAG TPA: hypothetical protein VM658_20420 [bacterium]|nr:hypothetical protein [bacterium]
MLEPTLPLSQGSAARDRLREHYSYKKDEYLELCWQYNLPPKDLSLLLMGKRSIASGDRIRLIRLVILLMDMEKLLDRRDIEDYLFAENEAHYSNSGIFRHELH